MEKRIYQLLKLSGRVNSSQEAQVLLDQDRVKVNGVAVHSLKYKVNTKFQIVTLDNQPLQVIEQHVYILIHKARGYSCQPGEKRPYVLDFISCDKNLKKTLFVVGRLDVDTEGALLITNDGKLAHKLLSPKSKVPKTYSVHVKGVVTPESVEKLRKGVVITLEVDHRLTKYRTKPTLVKVIERTDASTWLEITITEGKKRQVRRMCDAIGHAVIELIRTKIGKLDVSSMEPGGFQYLTKKELDEKL